MGSILSLRYGLHPLGNGGLEKRRKGLVIMLLGFLQLAGIRNKTTEDSYRVKEAVRSALRHLTRSPVPANQGTLHNLNWNFVYSYALLILKLAQNTVL